MDCTQAMKTGSGQQMTRKYCGAQSGPDKFHPHYVQTHNRVACLFLHCHDASTNTLHPHYVWPHSGVKRHSGPLQNAQTNALYPHYGQPRSRVIFFPPYCTVY